MQAVKVDYGSSDLCMDDHWTDMVFELSVPKSVHKMRQQAIFTKSVLQFAWFVIPMHIKTSWIIDFLISRLLMCKYINGI